MPFQVSQASRSSLRGFRAPKVLTLKCSCTFPVSAPAHAGGSKLGASPHPTAVLTFLVTSPLLHTYTEHNSSTVSAVICPGCYAIMTRKISVRVQCRCWFSKHFRFVVSYISGCKTKTHGVRHTHAWEVASYSAQPAQTIRQLLVLNLK